MLVAALSLFLLSLLCYVAPSSVPLLSLDCACSALDVLAVAVSVFRARAQIEHNREINAIAERAEEDNTPHRVVETAVSARSQAHGDYVERSTYYTNGIKVVGSLAGLLMYLTIWYTLGFKSSLIDLLLFLSVRNAALSVHCALVAHLERTAISRDLADSNLFNPCAEVKALTDVCSICQHPYTAPTFKMNCGHALHRVCAHELLRRAGKGSKCPMCRQAVYPQRTVDRTGGGGGSNQEAAAVAVVGAGGEGGGGVEDVAGGAGTGGTGGTGGGEPLLRWTLPAWLPIPAVRFEINRVQPPNHPRPVFNLFSTIWAMMSQTEEERLAFVTDMFPNRSREEITAALRGGSVDDAVVILSGGGG